jgi:hypothetical protein
VGFYESEQAALKVVVDSLDRYGTDAVATLALAYTTPGDVRPIAEGAELANRALALVRASVASPPPATPASPARVPA